MSLVFRGSEVAIKSMFVCIGSGVVNVGIRKFVGWISRDPEVVLNAFYVWARMLGLGLNVDTW